MVSVRLWVWGLHYKALEAHIMKNGTIEIKKNVLRVLALHEKLIKNYAARKFSEEIFNNIQDYNITSPIEQIFISALNCAFDIMNIESEGIFEAWQWFPQYKVGKYYVDFIVQYFERHGEDESYKLLKSVIIECDSQEFHDRTEKERRYEKARDRYIQQQGYTVFRFTGSEIMEDSMLVAADVVAFLCNGDKEDIHGAIMDLLE